MDGRRRRGRKSSKKSQVTKDSELALGGQTDLNEEYLQSVADCILPKKWKRIFRSLMCMQEPDAPPTQSVEVLIQTIENDHPNQTTEQIYQALLKWKSDRGRHATRNALHSVLKKHNVDYSLPNQPAVAQPEGTGLRQRRSSTGRRVQLRWEADKLSILKQGGAKWTTELHGEFFSTEDLAGPSEIPDEVSIVDAMLTSIVDPNNSNSDNNSRIKMIFQMELGETTKRFADKFGKFRDLGFGDVASFVSRRSRRMELVTSGGNQTQMVQQCSQHDESEQDQYETASKASSCPDSCASLGEESCPPSVSEISTRGRIRSAGSSPAADPVRELSAEDLLPLITDEVESGHLVFKTEAAYEGADGDLAFSRYVAALWNEPKKPTAGAYIILGVGHNATPPHDLQGLKATDKSDEDYQRKFRDGNFSHRPRFRYQEVPCQGKVFGVVAVANAHGSDWRPCYEIDACERCHQPSIPVLEGGQVTATSPLRHEGQWRHYRGSEPSPRGQPQPQTVYRREHEEDTAWRDFVERLDVENQWGHSYCLLAGHCPPDTDCLDCVGRFPWDRVWDFDPDSRSAGLLSACDKETLARFSLRTWRDAAASPAAAAAAAPSPVWLMVCDTTPREDTLVPGDANRWIQTLRAPLNAECDRLCELAACKPLVVIVLWYGDGDSTQQHLCKALSKIAECPNVASYIVCLPPAVSDRRALTERLHQLEAQAPIEIPLDRLCLGLSDLPCCKGRSAQSTELPGRVGQPFSSQDLQRLRQELDVLFVEMRFDESEQADWRAFYRGGTLTWHDMHLHSFDAKRNILPALTEQLRRRLTISREACKVTLFHEPGAGGTTLGRRVLWDLHTDFPCACATSDVLDPRRVLEQLKLLSRHTQKPVLLLVDGQEPRLVDELLRLAEEANVDTVVLSVQRYLMDITKKISREDKFWLKGEVDSTEAERFRHIFLSLDAGKKEKLQKMVQDVESGTSPRYVYEFGLTLYNSNYIGLRSYVSSYLRLTGSLDSWQTAVAYLALVSYYGQKKTPCHFFSTLFDVEELEVVRADDVLTHAGKQFVLEDEKKCTWQMTYYAVAKEILEQVLSRDQGGAANAPEPTGGGQLSEWARRHLKDLAKEFLTYAADRKRQSGQPSRIVELVRSMFIRRSYVDQGPDEGCRRKPLARIVCDIPSQKDQLELMNHLVHCFPDDPTCATHLGRAYTQTKKYDLARQHLNRASELRMEEINVNKSSSGGAQAVSHCLANESGIKPDSVLCTIEHCLGIVCSEEIKEAIGGWKQDSVTRRYSPDEFIGQLREIQSTVQRALAHFRKCRQHFTRGMNASYSYLGEIRVRLCLANFVKTHYGQGGYHGFLESGQGDDALKELVEECFSTTVGLFRDLRSHQSLTVSGLQEMDTYQRHFCEIFDDVYGSYRRWLKRGDVTGIRNMIEVVKCEYWRIHRGGPFRAVLETIVGPALDEFTVLYEMLFQEAQRGVGRTDLSVDLRDWLAFLRNGNLRLQGGYSIRDRVLPEVIRCRVVSSPDAAVIVLYYQYVLSVVLVLESQRFDESYPCDRLLDELKAACARSTRHQQRRAVPLEWLGPKRHGADICRLVNESCLGRWSEEKRFWSNKNALERLQVCRGVITDAERGRITLDGGGALPVAYSPKRSQLAGERYLNVQVEFCLGFTIHGGAEAFSVQELKKRPCKRCRGEVAVSRLDKSAQKVCSACSHAV